MKLKQQQQQQQESNHETKTNVIYIHKSNAKYMKTVLEKENVINKIYRMCPSAATTTTTSIISNYDHDNTSNIGAVHNTYNNKDIIAIPVLFNNAFEKIDDKECKSYIIGHGIQSCPYSSTMLGNYHVQQQQNETTTTTSSPQKPKFKNLVQQILYQSCIQISQQPNHQKTTMKHNDILLLLEDEIVSLDTNTCPKSLEILGKNDTLLLPSSNTFRFQNHTSNHLLHDLFYNNNSYSKNINLLYQNLCKTYKVKRIVRRNNGISCNSCIRESTFCVVWPEYSQEESNLQGPKSPGWITTIENNIYQSYDMTKVMFSRGNITEKIRFAKLLSQQQNKNKEIILDLYTGIGYYTLPALVYGNNVHHVHACEWNKEALYALKYNVKQNNIPQTKVTLYNIDSRTILQKQPQLQNTIDRVILGLLPSSQGGWKVAIQALNNDVGGWLHIHGNVCIEEKRTWMIWVCFTLLSYVTIKQKKEDKDWIVICTHVEHVKSFAPKIDHLVMDVFIGPSKEIIFNDASSVVVPNILQREMLQQEYCIIAQEEEVKDRFAVFDKNELICISSLDDNDVDLPSCALDLDDGVFSEQDWMK